VALPCLLSTFRPSRHPGTVRIDLSMCNLKSLGRLELVAASHAADAGGVPLFRWEPGRTLPDRCHFSASVSLRPVREWQYFLPRLNVEADDDALLVVDGYGDHPIYPSGTLADVACLRVGRGPLLCPTCCTELGWDQVLFGGSSRQCVENGLLQQRVAVWPGRWLRRRRRPVGVDALGNIFPQMFCPMKHPLPEHEGVHDRLIVGVLGEQQLVRDFAARCADELLRRHDDGLFLGPGYNAHPEGMLDVEHGILLSIQPRRNYFPISFWMFGLWAGPQQGPSPAYAIAPHVESLILVLDPTRQPALAGRTSGTAGAGPADVLVRFTEQVGATPGTKLAISLAVVLTQCDRLISQGLLPQRILWNLPPRGSGGRCPLVHSDTSARLGSFLAKTAPGLYTVAKNWFSSVSFFGVGAKAGDRSYRCTDPVTWLLAERGQVPVMKASAALTQVGSYASDDYVFRLAQRGPVPCPQ
jgi:hypothetical protein